MFFFALYQAHVKHKEQWYYIALAFIIDKFIIAFIM